MRKLKFRLIKDDKIVGYEEHSLVTFRDKPSEILIFHSIHGKLTELEVYNILIYPDKYISHDKKEQFTGLLDKNGVEIYEGDIVKDHCKSKSKKEIIEIIFYQGCFSAIYTKNHYPCLYEILEDGTGNGFLEVIGNIHENPDLLETKP